MLDDTVQEKYFVFSDESGSWHDINDIYVRSWVIVHESSYDKLIDSIDYIISETSTKELKWKTIAGNKKYWDFIKNFDFRIFLTVSCISDIDWEGKYRITRDFNNQVNNLDFGEIDDSLQVELKKKIFDDIKNILFLNYYEKTHISNAREGIDRVLPKRENLLIYRVDPPQMSKKGWSNILKMISSDVQLEFPKSHADEGIQFADIIAGCVRSFLIEDERKDIAKEFIAMVRNKIISNSWEPANPNPNLIFYNEINDKLKKKVKDFCNIKQYVK